MLSSCLKILNKIILFLWKGLPPVLLNVSAGSFRVVRSGSRRSSARWPLRVPLPASPGIFLYFNSLGTFGDSSPSRSERGARRAWLAFLLSPYFTLFSKGLAFRLIRPQLSGARGGGSPSPWMLHLLCRLCPLSGGKNPDLFTPTVRLLRQRPSAPRGSLAEPMPLLLRRGAARGRCPLSP